MTPRAEVASARVFDAFPELVQVCDLPLRSFGGLRAIAGPCFTIRSGDHLAVREALSEPCDRGILLVDQTSTGNRVAMLGDKIASLAVANGWRGVIVNGAIRDSASLGNLALGVFALCTTPRRYGGGPTQFERPPELLLGGAAFLSGNWIVADEDGLVTAPEWIVRGALSVAGAS